MTVSAAQLMVNIGGNAAGAQAAITSTAAMLGKTGMLGMAAVGAGAVMVGVGAIATKMAGDFQAGITSLATGAGESTKNLQMVSDGILQMARDTGTSTQQLIAGMYMIESGGYHGAAGLAILKAAAEGAKVGVADLGVVADATDTVLKNFSRTGIDASTAVNVLIATVANGKTHMEDLAGSLSHVLPTAAAARIGLNSVMGAMATMTAEGVPAADAATYLRQMMIALMAPTAGSRKALAELGITTDELATKLHQGLPQALQLIQQQLTAHGIQEGSSKYMEMMRSIAGGSKQMQGMLLLGGDNLGRFTDIVNNKINPALKNGSGQIVGWSLVQKTFNQQLDRAGATAETLMIQLGQKLLPVATKFVSWLADKALPAIQQFASFISGSSQQAEILRPILLAVAIAIGGALVASFIAWAASAAAAAVATIAATWPILAIGAAIALFVAAIIWAYNHIGPFRDAINRVRDAIGAMFQYIGSVVLPAIGRFIPWLIKLFSDLGHFIGHVIGAVLGFFVGFFQAVATFFGSLPGRLAAFLSAVGTFFSNLIGTILGFFGHILGAIGRFIGDWVGAWLTLERQTVQHVLSMAGDLLAHIGRMKDALIARIEFFVLTTIGKFLYLKQEAIQHAQDLATGFLQALAGLPGKLLALGEQMMQQLAQGIRNAAVNVVGALKSIPGLGGVVGGLQSVIPHFASGGTMAQGGMALVGEQGPELVYLPSGARVSPTPSSGVGGGGSGQPLVIQLQVDGRKMAEVTVPYLPGVIRNATGNHRM